jgi:hypothetical protein
MVRTVSRRQRSLRNGPAIYGGPFDLTVGARADPHIQQLTDVVVPVVLDAREYISR